MKSIDIIILHFGNIAVTKRCLKSIEDKSSSYRQIMLVNNDPRIKLEEKINPDKRRLIINTGKNLGFAAGVNIGIKRSLEDDAEYIVLLNNDTIVDEDFIKPLYEFLEVNKNAGISGPVIAFQKNGKTFFDYGGKVNQWFGKTNHENRNYYLKEKPQRIDYVSGCCMMIKTSVFATIGLFDEQFFMYYEDVDFCFRAKDAGYSTWVVPAAVINHELSRTVNEEPNAAIYYLLKSEHIFARKYHQRFPLMPLDIIKQSLIFLLKKPSSISAIGRAWM